MTLKASTVKFLKDLGKNNNKAWFDARRDRYLDAKEDFENFIGLLISAHGRKDPEIADLIPKKCTFRINRDVRFSKDKSPYKNNMGASVNRGGKKSIFAGYYFHLEPGKSFVGGGLWMPLAPDMKKVRQEIDYCLKEFKDILQHKKFRSFYGDLYAGEDVSLTRVPQGFEKDNPAAAYLRLKSWLAMRPVTDAELVSGDLVSKSAEGFEALQPLIKFINRSLED